MATCSLAGAFASASVLGVDSSPVMLARAEGRAARLGVADRVELRSHDLNDDLQALGSFDLVWAALALHHANDEPAMLRSVGSLLCPRGLLCLIERADPMVVRLAHDLGRPGLWDRVGSAQSAWFERTRPARPGTASAADYAAMLEETGFELLASRTLTDTVTAPDEPAVHRLIAEYLRRVQTNLDGILDTADLAGWEDAEVTSTRTLLIARA